MSSRPSDERPDDGSPFERDVRGALEKIKAEALAKIHDAEGVVCAAEVRISITKVVRASGRGRTWVHQRYPHLIREIQEAQGEVSRARGERRWSRPKSKEELEKIISDLKAEMERRVAAIASQQLSEVRAKLTPGARERDALLAENADLKEKLAEAERTHMTQTEMIRMLLEANNVQKS